jgi:phosphoribosylglycinamide formyltransferase 1
MNTDRFSEIARAGIIPPTCLEIVMDCLVAPSLPITPDRSSGLRLGIMASGSGSNFAAVAEAIAAGQLQAKIVVLIYNNPGIKALEHAEKYQIPTVFHDHRGVDRSALDAAIIQTLQEYQVNCVVMAGWMRVVTPVLIDAFPDRIINIHPSLLPSFPGIKAIEQALAAKVKISGCTVHLVRPMVDSGPILIQAAVPVLPNDTAETLHTRIQIQEHRILPAALKLL